MLRWRGGSAPALHAVGRWFDPSTKYFMLLLLRRTRQTVWWWGSPCAREQRPAPGRFAPWACRTPHVARTLHFRRIESTQSRMENREWREWHDGGVMHDGWLVGRQWWWRRRRELLHLAACGSLNTAPLQWLTSRASQDARGINSGGVNAAVPTGWGQAGPRGGE